MYTSDTPNGVIYRTPVDEQGEPGRREIFRQFKEGEGIPDGAAVDVEGCYWSALFDGWRIARFSPQGEQLEEYRLPVRCPTMVCFGGDDMKTLFITTTRENMDAEEVAEYPLSGAIFTCRKCGRDEEKSLYRTLAWIDRHDVFARIAAQHFMERVISPSSRRAFCMEADSRLAWISR